MMQRNISSLFTDQPLVSVVIPCLNRAHFLVPTVESILQQDYPHIECVVVDGGSTDGTQDILRHYDGRIRWLSEPDRGPPDAINKGWRMCSGEILTWLNADDVWAPGAVSTAVSYFLEHPEVDVVYGDCGIINQDGRQVEMVHVPDWNVRNAVEYCDHIIYQAASFMRRTILERVGWLWPKLCHDQELWLRISLAHGRLQHISALLAYARHHDGNLGYRSDIVIPLKLEITRNFFTNPNLPCQFDGLRNRAISNAYLRCIDYVFLDHFRWFRNIGGSIGLLYEAIKADKSNGVRTLKSLTQLPEKVVAAILRRYLSEQAYRGLRAWKRQIVGILFRGSLAQQKGA